jgi:hypothetical protein
MLEKSSLPNFVENDRIFLLSNCGIGGASKDLDSRQKQIVTRQISYRTLVIQMYFYLYRNAKAAKNNTL